jgi:hypothetical protein
LPKINNQYKPYGEWFCKTTSMKILIIFALVSFISINLYATTPCGDSIPQEKQYKISRQQFLDKYGKDDTARTIINYYFTKRKASLYQTIITTTLTTLSGIIFTKIVGNGPINIAGFFLAIALGWFILIAGLYIFLSIHIFFFYSRKNLLKVLGNYFSDRGIPSKLRRHLYGKKSQL